jgi:DNA primase
MVKLAEHTLPSLKPDHSLNFAILPKDMDPDEVINVYGKHMIKNVLDSAISLSQLLWETYIKTLPKNPTAEQKSALEQKLFDLSAQIQNPIMRSNYRRYFSEQLWQHFRQQTNKRNKPNISPEIFLTLDDNSDIIGRCEKNLFAMILCYPDLLNNCRVKEELSALELHETMLDRLRTAILEDNSDNLCDSLKNNGFAGEVEYLCGTYSSFAKKTSIDHKFILPLWRCNIDKYYITLMQHERTAALNEMTEASLNKAQSLEKQIILLTQEIGRIEESLYEEN